MIIKIVAKKAGGHVHASFWTARAMNRTFEGSGTLTFRDYEWPLMARAFRKMLHAAHVNTGEIVVDVFIIEEGFDENDEFRTGTDKR